MLRPDKQLLLRDRLARMSSYEIEAGGEVERALLLVTFRSIPMLVDRRSGVDKKRLGVAIIGATTPEDAVTRVTKSCGLVWEIRWGMLVVATRERLAVMPRDIEVVDLNAARARQLFAEDVDLRASSERLDAVLDRILSGTGITVKPRDGVDLRKHVVSFGARSWSMTRDEALCASLLPLGLMGTIKARELVIDRASRSGDE